jgi:hypothetical protein
VKRAKKRETGVCVKGPLKIPFLHTLSLCVRASDSILFEWEEAHADCAADNAID